LRQLTRSVIYKIVKSVGLCVMYGYQKKLTVYVIFQNETVSLTESTMSCLAVIV